MKRLIIIIVTMLLLCGCAAEDVPEPTPTPSPTPNLYLEWSGEWTYETGDGSVIWHLEDDGRARIPAVPVDEYREIGGLGTWTRGEVLTVDIGETLLLQPVKEDGFRKLFCPELNETLVRAEEREAAYAAKFMEVELTDANIQDYFYFERVPNPVDGNGQRIWNKVYVMRSTLYDQGWVFWNQREVKLDFRYWTSYHMEAEKMPYGVSVLVDKYNEMQAEGTLIFIKADHLSELSYDGKTRRLVDNTGQVWEEAFETFRYAEYLY